MVTRAGPTFHHPEGSRKGGPVDVAPCIVSAIAFAAVRPVRAHPRGGSAGPDIGADRGTCGRYAIFGMAAREVEPGMTTGAQRRNPERAWKRLTESLDYVADWHASAGPTVREVPPHAFRRQSEADLEAARWNLLAWEDPHHPQWPELFRVDVAMVEARAAEPGDHGWPRLVRRAGATFTGLRLLDGALVLKVWRGRETAQIRVIDGAAFNPALSGLEVAMRRGVGERSGWVRVESLVQVVFGG